MLAGDQDTIFAPATAAGRAAITVLRLSGPASGTALEALCGGPLPTPRRLVLRRLRHPGSRDPLDEALVVWLPGPHTFTGEDQAEIHAHGGPAVRGALLRALAAVPGCRPAQAGEFTRRAFLNGRMDLTRVEGLADLIAAETEAQRRQALRQLEGRLGVRVEGWRERLIAALASLEAVLDFSDEGDVPTSGLEAEAAGSAAALAAEIGAELAGARHGERVREGFVVVLAGPTNAGKSSLLNAVARRDVAIVSELPGTTRDAIEVRCNLGGLPVTLIDTAGLRPTADPVEREGIARTRARAASADLVLWLEAPDVAPEPPPGDLGEAPSLRVATKADLGVPGAGDAAPVSARTGQGLPELLAVVEERLRGACPSGDALVTRERHRLALVSCREALQRVGPALAGGGVELAAEDLRLALRALGQITGRVDVEDVLDALFAGFCIGK